MKKALISIFACAFILLSVAPANAYISRWHKLTTGFKEILCAPFSIITETANQLEKNDEKVLAVIGGAMEGTAQTAVKPVTGTFKILTFPFLD